jgi:hypothetical protein
MNVIVFINVKLTNMSALEVTSSGKTETDTVPQLALIKYLNLISKPLMRPQMQGCGNQRKEMQDLTLMVKDLTILDSITMERLTTVLVLSLVLNFKINKNL